MDRETQIKIMMALEMSRQFSILVSRHKLGDPEVSEDYLSTVSLVNSRLLMIAYNAIVDLFDDVTSEEFDAYLPDDLKALAKKFDPTAN